MVKKFFLIAGIIFIFDSITKFFVMLYKPNVEVLPFLRFVYVENTGGVFGIGQGGNIFFILVSLGIIAGLSWWFYKKRLHAIPLGLIIGGALGNLVDRLLYGFVVDFINFFVGSFSWYVFNIADAAVVIGIVWILYEEYFESS